MAKARSRSRIRPATPAEASLARRRAVDKIQFAPAPRAEELGPFVDRIVATLGMSWAFVSDASTIADFVCLDRDPDARVRALGATLGVEVHAQDAVVDVAARLRLRTLN